MPTRKLVYKQISHCSRVDEEDETDDDSREEEDRTDLEVCTGNCKA
jgi:hypothetical protein